MKTTQSRRISFPSLTRTLGLGAWLIATADSLAAPNSKPASSYDGFNLWLTDNPHEVKTPQPLEWSNGGTQIPSWLTGTYMKVGPAKTQFGDEDDARYYQNMVDGWAKINKFTFDEPKEGEPTRLHYSSGFVDTPLFQQFDKLGRMTAHTTLGPAVPPFTEEDQAPPGQDNGQTVENNNVTLEKMKIGKKTAFIASTDSTTVNNFDKTTFAFLESINAIPGTMGSEEEFFSKEELQSLLEFEEAEKEQIRAELKSGDGPLKKLLKILGFIDGEIEEAVQVSDQELEVAIQKGFDTIKLTYASCAHWKKRPGQTDNVLNYGIAFGLSSSRVSVYQYDDGDLTNPRNMAGYFGVKLDFSTLIHQFSVTPKYAVFFCYPVYLDLLKLIRVAVKEPWNLQNMLRFMDFHYKKDDLWGLLQAKDDRELRDTEIIVVDLEANKVVSKSSVPGFYGTHHVNANETTDRKVVCDVVHAPNNALTMYTDKEYLKNTLVREDVFTNDFEIVRYTINLVNGSPTQVQPWSECFGTTPSSANRAFVNQFDFPVVNPRIAGYKNRYAYGQALLDFQRQYLVKKDLTVNGQDKIWPDSDSTNCQYSGEPLFVPNPDADVEDDGVVLCLVLDGTKEKSYLLVLDGKTFLELDRAYLDFHIPMTIHGNWFDETS